MGNNQAETKSKFPPRTKFRIGDFCRLKCGGVKMIVEGVTPLTGHDPEMVACLYMHNGDIKRFTFNAALIFNTRDHGEQDPDNSNGENHR